MIELIFSIAKSIGVSPLLLLSVCQEESGFKKVVKYDDGGRDSIGVCQVQRRTALEFGSYYDKLALLQPSVNITIAGLYLKKQIKRYKNPWNAIAAYNSGSLKYCGIKVCNSIYVDKVRKVYDNYLYGR